MPRAPSRPEPTRHILCRGLPVPVPFIVHTYRQTGWQFHGRSRIRTSLVCNHWTAAENSPLQMYTNMLMHLDAFSKKPEPLSVHFCVDQNGQIYQMADAEQRCVHAGDANDRSIGIEFICRGSDLTKPPKGWTRERVTDVIHGQKVRYDNLLPEQIAAGVKLNEALCKLYTLPMVVPETKEGEVYADNLSALDAASFRGCVGHLHFHESKVDPGLRLLQAIQRRGRESGADIG